MKRSGVAIAQVVAASILLLWLVTTIGASADDTRVPVETQQTQLAVVSEDPYTNPGTYHLTEVEPDSFAFGSTIVSTFQAGRSYACGASNLGWSVSSDAGSKWTEGFLPGTTIHATPLGRGSEPPIL